MRYHLLRYITQCIRHIADDKGDGVFPQIFFSKKHSQVSDPKPNETHTINYVLTQGPQSHVLLI